MNTSLAMVPNEYPIRPLDRIISEVPKSAESRRAQFRIILGGKGAANRIKSGVVKIKSDAEEKVVPILPLWKQAQSLEEKVAYLRKEDQAKLRGTEKELEELKQLVKNIDLNLVMSEENEKKPPRAKAREITDEMKKNHVLYLKDATEWQEKFTEEEAGYWDIEGLKASPEVIKGVLTVVEFLQNIPKDLKRIFNMVDINPSLLSHMAAAGLIAGHIAEKDNEKAGKMVVNPVHVAMGAAGHDFGKGHATINEAWAFPGKFNKLMGEIMDLHPDIGEIFWKAAFKLPNVPEIMMEAKEMIIRVAKQHHERMDGRGYTEGLTSDEIAIESKYANVADSAHAMWNKRPHDTREFNDRGEELVKPQVKEGQGGQFDKEKTNTFLNSFFPKNSDERKIRFVDHRTYNAKTNDEEQSKECHLTSYEDILKNARDLSPNADYDKFIDKL